LDNSEGHFEAFQTRPFLLFPRARAVFLSLCPGFLFSEKEYHNDGSRDDFDDLPGIGYHGAADGAAETRIIASRFEFMLSALPCQRTKKDSTSADNVTENSH